MKRYVILPLILMSFIMNAQRSEEKQQTLSLDRYHYAFSGDKIGFNFTGLGLGYQFVNCGGDVQLGINYKKNVNFTTFSYNEKNVGASEVGSELWPKPNEIEVQEIEASLYFGTQNLGKVNLNYIVGNFSGCFGETFDVLAQVGQDPKAKEYKDQINDLTLRNITIIRADAIGDNRRYKIIEKLKAKDVDADVLRLFKAADVESSLGNYETAKAYYQDVNRLKYSPETQNRINEMNRLISERNAKEKETANSAQPTSSASSSTSNTTSKPSNAVKKETGNKEEKEEEKTTNTEEKEDTYIDRSARNEVRQNSGLNNTYNNTNQNNNALVNQGYAINQQSKRTEQVIDNAVNQVNSIFQGNIDRINREKAERDAQEDDSYENTALYRADQERKRKERDAEIWRKNQLTKKTQSRQERLDAYNAKGGIQNNRSQFAVWHFNALKETLQIKDYIVKYNGTYPSFINSDHPTPVPNNNCEYVQVIESIQFSAMPISYKNTLIRNLLNIRFAYHKFYTENTFQELDWKIRSDDLYWDLNYATCGNYLDEVAITLKSGFYNSGADLMHYVNNKYSNSEMAEGNYEIPVGTNSDSKVFFTEGRNLGITSINNESLNSFINYNLDQVWLKFHTNPWNWSNSSFSFDRKDKNMKSLPKSMSSMQIEIDRYIALYDLKRKFALNSKDDEKNQMFFNYHMGNYTAAYNHFQRYIFLEYGNFQGLLEFVKTIKKGNDGHIGITGAILLMENKEFEKALQLLNVIKESNWVKNLKKENTYMNSGNNMYDIKSYTNPIIAAVNKIKNSIYYQTGEYDKIIGPKSENEVKELLKNAESEFKFVPRTPKDIWKQHNDEMPSVLNKLEREYLDNTLPHIQASALIKLGNLKLANAVLEDMVKYYTKNDKKNPKVFYGSPLEIDAFKTSVKTLFPGKEDKIEYRIGNMNLFPLDFKYFVRVPIMFLTRLPYVKPTYMNTQPIDLSNNVQWETLKKSLYEHNGSKEKMMTVLESLRDIYNTGKLVHNEESRFFLEVYMHFALALGEFHEATIPMAQLESDYSNHNLILERNLIKLMWPQKDNILTKSTFDYSTYKNLSNNVKDYFETEVKNSEHLKKELNSFLSLWSSLKVSSPMIPYLYSLYEN